MRIRIEIEPAPGITAEPITFNTVIDLIDLIAPTDHRIPIRGGVQIVTNRHGTLHIERTD